MSAVNSRAPDYMLQSMQQQQQKPVSADAEDEIYQFPNSPVQSNPDIATATATAAALAAANSFQHQNNYLSNTRQESPRMSARNSTGGLLFAHSNNSNSSSMSNYLNIPDSFLDQHRSTGVNNVNNFPEDPLFNMYLDDAMDVDAEQERPNPFSEYGNPDLEINKFQDFYQPQHQIYLQAPFQVRNQSGIPALPQQFAGMPNRRHRITLLDEENDSNKKKEDEYLLFNPNIEPSHLISDDVNPESLWNSGEDFLFVPPTSQEKNSTYFPDINNAIIPGYENDYLLYEDFEEDVEEDISEDEDDEEGNYFHVDDEFDELMMSNMNNNQDDYDMTNMNNYSKPANVANGQIPSHMYDQVLKLRSQMQDFQIDDQGVCNSSSAVTSANASAELFDREEAISFTGGDFSPELDNANATLKDNQDGDFEESPEEAQDTTEAKSQLTGVDMTAHNPNHQCDLINPASGLPCNKQFSRPYDLIRHQETIHASKKKIFRCVICEGRLEGGPGNGKQKTFSRGDALSRHIKVKHGLTGADALELINKAKENVEFISVY